MSLPKIISLFSGAGGLDLGFTQADYTVAFALDKSEDAVKTHRRNFKTTHSVVADLTQANVDEIMSMIEEVIPQGEAVGVIGGPPCQGFSRANTTSCADDPRNKLPFIYLNIIEELQTKYIVKFVLFENVQGILDAKHSGTFEAVINRFRDLGLFESIGKYSALKYGVPQTRTRVIIAAFDSVEMKESFRPIEFEADDLTVRHAIGGLPEPAFFRKDLTVNDIPFHPNHWTMVPRSRKFFSKGNEGSSGRCFRRLKWDEPSPTVAYGHREIHVHPDGKRRLSIFEAMLLQGFPESFVLEGSLSSQVEQVSNAVPPPLGKALAEAISVSLGENDGR